MQAHSDRVGSHARTGAARGAAPVSPLHLYAAAAALTVLNVAGAFVPHSEATWAIAYPKTIPAGARVLIALAGPIAAMAIAVRASRAATRTRAATMAIARTPWPWMALLLALHIFLPNTHPYGDAVRFYRFIPDAAGPEANAPLSFEAHRLLARLFPDNLVFAFSSLAAIGGLIAVPGLFRLARALFPEAHDACRRTLFLAGMTGTCAWQIYAGYVEHYHVQLALVFWGLAFLLAADESAGFSPIDDTRVRSQRGITIAALFLGLAAAWNLSAAWIAPVPALVAYRRGGGALAARAIAFALLPVAVTLALVMLTYGPAQVAASYAGGFHPFATPFAGFLPFSEWFSRAHLLFLVNEALLVAPVAVALAVAAVPRTLPRLALLLLPALFAFSWNPRLGWAKDWDLFVWPYVVIQVVILESVVRREPDPPRRLPWAALLGSAAALALSYIVCNSALGQPR
ncbi:MAG: hypothetical protein ACKVU1_18520 [bacterium]